MCDDEFGFGFIVGLIIGVFVTGLLMSMFLHSETSETYSDFCKRHDMKYDSRMNYPIQCYKVEDGNFMSKKITRIDGEIYFECQSEDCESKGGF